MLQRVAVIVTNGPFRPTRGRNAKLPGVNKTPGGYLLGSSVVSARWCSASLQSGQLVGTQGLHPTQRFGVNRRESWAVLAWCAISGVPALAIVARKVAARPVPVRATTAIRKPMQSEASTCRVYRRP